MVCHTVQDIKDVLQRRDGHHPEFCQAVTEILESLTPILEKEPKYIPIFERMLEPERVIIFRVPWINDKGEVEVNRGFRVQFNSAIGPYKGGLRFHPSVNLSILKFLGFEQILKNALSTLPIGGGKGGADFDPKGKSDREVMAFCQSFMTELSKHIGQFTDVPAGDIGVGAREIGYMFGQYKRLRNEFSSVLTGKKLSWGGSLIRPEATGYGCIYFLQEMMKDNGDEIKGKTILIQGSGNVAQFAAKKCIQLGAKVISLSDSTGCVIEKDGFTAEQLAEVMRIKNELRGRMKQYCDFSKTAQYYEGKKPIEVVDFHIDAVVPCATQNELNETDAKKMPSLGVKYVCEGSNMSSTNEACTQYHENKIFYGPGKAANCGGVSVSALEMSQCSMRLQWDAEKVDSELHGIMKKIFQQCRETAIKYNKEKNYQFGANVAGFLKVADAMIDQGCC